VFAPGQSIGNYRIISQIGSGGMGAVYLAEHPLIGKKIALKVIHRDLAQNREVIQRFFQEAKAVNKIGHEHIVTVHDFGQSDENDHFYIMEYVDGITLAKVLSNETVINSQRALHIGSQIAAGLAAAHAAGIIHRDLKPDNIMLCKRGRTEDYVKILDFGLAKVFSGEGGGLTAIGVVLGTPQYMSPEACESKRDIDHRTDIYALGVLLFQMLTGRLPFDGATMGEILIKQVTTLPPPLRAFNSAVAPSVEQIVLRCLAKRPDDRFATMAALRDALLAPEEYLAHRPPISPARSLVPGEGGADAASVLAHVEARKAQQAAAATAPVALRGGALPLRAPAPTLIDDSMHGVARASTTGPSDPAMPAAVLNKTMRLPTPVPPPAVTKKTRPWIPLLIVLGAGVGVGLAAGVAGRHGQSATKAGIATAVTVDAAPLIAAADAAPQVVADAVAVAPVDALALDAAPVATTAPDAAVSADIEVLIDSSPQGADVVVGKTVVGRTPFTGKLPSGEIAVVVRMRGYVSERRALAVVAGASLKVTLRKASGAAAGSGKGSNHDHDGLMRPDDL
jgi:tRNA A-37 threonylcarbamoyl transferase component Bud32